MGATLQSVSPEHLRIGMYVHLDCGWMRHSFPFNKFLIRSEEQIREIRALGLARVSYDPKKSTAEPGAQQSASSAPVGPVAPADAVNSDKKNNAQQLARTRREIAVVEQQLKKAADALKAITRNLHADPLEAHREATALVVQMVDSLLDRNDVLLHAIGSNCGEDVYHHSLNVTVLSLMLGNALRLPAADMRELGVGAMFHDIGKIDIPKGLLLRTDPLTKAAQNLIDQHPAYGLKYAKALGLSEAATAIVLEHHEQMDGGGYPGRLAGEQITPLARLVAIVNAYDNLCNPVNQAKAVSPSEALSTMFALMRHRFDEAMLKTFIHCLGVYPPGSVVQLSNDMIGLVISANPAHSLKPYVLVYDKDVPRDEAIIVNLESESDIKICKSLRPALLPLEIYQYLSPRTRVTYYFNAANEKAPG